jgi:hypothetical protein
VNVDANPVSEYHTRLEARRAAAARYDHQYFVVSLVRLAIAVAFVALAVGWWRDVLSAWWLALPVVAFGVAVFVHARIADLRRRAARAVTFYEHGLARIEDRWIGLGQSTEAFRDETHLYAPDLDLFGKASLFELLCTARTRSGEETLANWLSSPADRAEILERQQAIEELRHKLDLREALAVTGSAIRPSIHPVTMARWGEAPPSLKNRWPVIAAPILAAAVSCVLLGALLRGGGNLVYAYYGGLILEAAFLYIFRKDLAAMVGAVTQPQKDLQVIRDMLVMLEREQFQSSKLIGLQSRLNAGGTLASREISHLTRLVDTLSFKGLDAIVLIVFMLFLGIIVPFSVLILLTPQVAFAIEKWRRRWGASVGPWISTVGEFEALCALANYAYEHPADPMPEITSDGPTFEGDDLRHPLIPASRSVGNSVKLNKELQLLVVSGSNMSGKSTLLRTAGVNAVLALAGAPVRAARLRLSPLALGATMRIHDSLQEGTSRFYAEIVRIRQIVDRASGEIPALYLLDEILHGTNSHDRAIGAEAIVKGLIDRGAIGLVTTHDLALAKVADAIAPRAANVHFEDQFDGDKLVFDYRMKPGVVQKSNALELMRAVGLKI